MILTKILLILFCLQITTGLSAQIHVAVHGSDRAAGTRDQPLATVAMALRKARELRRLEDTTATKGIHIYVNKGLYSFSEPLFIRPEDAGTATSPTIIEGATGETVVFSGGIRIRGWKKAGTVKGLPSRAAGNVWVATLPAETDLEDFRQLWVNDRKATRARDKNNDSLYRILSWDHVTQSCWIPKPEAFPADVRGMEMTIVQWWAIAHLRIRSASVDGNRLRLQFHQPESRIQSEHPWPAPWISAETGNSAFFLSNALTFLDTPGEWYLNKSTRQLFYWPLAYEDLNKDVVTAPSLETLVRVEGSPDQPVTNISFRNISFQHTGWLRPSQQGHVPHQAGMYMLDAYKLKTPGTKDKKTLENQAWVGRPASAVTVSFGHDIVFEDCRFQHLASTAIDFGKGVKKSSIRGNVFSDIGGTAILAGLFSDEATEVHLPYQPKDERGGCDSLRISNNLVFDVANEDWGCVGIGAGYVRNTEISHNDLSEMPYTAISLGWGWTPTVNYMRNNRVQANRIRRYGRQLYDVAGIYTLSAQPGTVISENDIDSIYRAPYAHIPSHWFYLYTDEGSAYMTVRDNWTSSQKYLQNSNGPGNTWTNNGPMVARDIRATAGLQPAYRHLLKYKSFQRHWPINRDLPVVIEIVARNKALDVERLRTVLKENGADPDALYQWQQHYVFFGKLKDAFLTKERLRKAFPEDAVKIYYDPFYDFNRSYCTDTTTAKEWDHVVLTANLVKDPVLQKAYMDYHRNQFRDWPEVSKGFCAADFQQLLLYRQGRQLMLIISIPKGASLDQLNPRTSASNPRMDAWNSIMKKFQEGIEGTRPGESWVFLKKLDEKN